MCHAHHKTTPTQNILSSLGFKVDPPSSPPNLLRRIQIMTKTTRKELIVKQNLGGEGKEGGEGETEKAEGMGCRNQITL